MEDVDLEKGIGVRDDGDAGRPDGPAEQRVDLVRSCLKAALRDHHN